MAGAEPLAGLRDHLPQHFNGCALGVEPAPELEQALLAYTRERIAHYKCPRSIDFIDELPRLPTGKHYKRLLKDRYWGKTDSRIV